MLVWIKFGPKANSRSRKSQLGSLPQRLYCDYNDCGSKQGMIAAIWLTVLLFFFAEYFLVQSPIMDSSGFCVDITEFGEKEGYWTPALV